MKKPAEAGHLTDISIKSWLRGPAADAPIDSRRWSYLSNSEIDNQLILLA
jgi:hypothetical protein